MAITAFTGPPGAGKSHALVKDVIIPAVIAGRHVLSNIDGLDPDAVRGYCLERVSDARTLGVVETFHGEDAVRPGFWPDESNPVARVSAGALVVFDEWALYFPKRGNWPPGCNVEAFLRWHRHLTGEGGQATDVAIGTQLPTDVHQNVRGLITKTYKFKKLTAIGADGTYAWLLFDGHLCPKGGHYKNGTGRYDPEVFPLYASSVAAAEGKHVELRTNKNDSIWTGGKAWAAVIFPVLLLIGGLFGLWRAWERTGGSPVPEQPKSAVGAPVASGGLPAPVSAAASPWRIVGKVEGDFGVRVVVADDKGSTRMLPAAQFTFDDGMPVAGSVDGARVVAEDRLPTALGSDTPWGGLLR